jgi:nucleoside-diphosphate-sugar epimerase
MVGHELRPVHKEPRTGDVRHSLADIGEARRLLGYEPKVKFEEGLRRTLAWYQGNR